MTALETEKKLSILKFDLDRTYNILWFADEERDVAWNQNWVYERDAWAKKHNVRFWGYGRPGFNPTTPTSEIIDNLFGGETPDLMVFTCWYMCIPPNDAGSYDCPKALMIEDNYKQCAVGVSDFVRRYKIDCLWHRYYTGLSELLGMISQRVGYSPKTVGVPWGVDPSVFHPTTSQPHDVSLMGQYTQRYYPTRYKVFREVAASGLQIVRLPHPSAFRPRGQRKVKTNGSVIGAAYAEALASAKIGITTGGAVGYTVARVFEIPACGSAMLCPKFWELEKKGFKSGIHYIEIDELDPVGQIKHLLTSHEGAVTRNSVIQNAKAMVLERHTWEHRVSETTAAMENVNLI